MENLLHPLQRYVVHNTSAGCRSYSGAIWGSRKINGSDPCIFVVNLDESVTIPMLCSQDQAGEISQSLHDLCL